ncbi:MAG: TerB family tellurite resistance protein [Parvularculaceae bacterium]|nr:TerB family tellurite resistance protein [Parvularculaceae bacterium]
MLDRLFRSFRQEESSTDSDDADLSKAVAALLVEAARADDDYSEDEQKMIVKILQGQFELDATQAESLKTEAEEAQAAANDLYGFSRVVKDGLDRDGKMKLIEDMWRVVLTDDERNPHEEMIIRRLVGLIYLEDRDSAEARRRAEA